MLNHSPTTSAPREAGEIVLNDRKTVNIGDAEYILLRVCDSGRGWAIAILPDGRAYRFSQYCAPAIFKNRDAALNDCI